MGIGERLLHALIKTWVGLITIFAFLLSILVFFVTPETDQIKTRWFIVAVICMICALAVVLRAFLDAVQETERSPKVVAALRSAPHLKGSKATLLVEPAWFFLVEGAVSVYQLSDEIEQELAIGFVVNIQQDRRVQVALVTTESNNDAIDHIVTNSKDVLKKLIIKPTVSRRFLESEQ